MTLGYLKQEAKTRESYKVQDGKRWFYTGDIGVVEGDGVIRIVGEFALKSLTFPPLHHPRAHFVLFN